MSIEKKCININRNNDNNNNILKSTPNFVKKQENSGYALSSWNYGSFHCSNPRFSKTQQPVKLIAAPEPQNCIYPIKLDQPRTAQVNKYGKRKLADNEKIVTEEFLKAMNDNKNIRGVSRKINKNRSSAILRNSSTNKNYKVDSEQHCNYSSNNYENENTSNLVRNNSNYTRDSNNNNIINYNYNNQGYPNNNTQLSNNITGNNHEQRNRSRISSAQKEKERIYKFGMTFDEWSENKNRQIQVIKNLNMLKEHELREYEKIEEKIEENYKKVQ